MSMDVNAVVIYLTIVIVEQKHALLTKIALVREVVMGAPLRAVLKQLVTRTVSPDLGKPIALVHHPNESFFLVPQAYKVIVIFPIRFSDSIDTVLATSFLQLADFELKEFLASDESKSDDSEKGDDTEKSAKRKKKQDTYPVLLQSGKGS
ncbi:Actin-related protein 2/3 complex subunit 2A [Capsicum annuum]|uniref:Arp2/3 complex 34 kDa subunit n=1 Tax=Capsicum annuum TaxID=4072 RepID=A0A2G2Z849_CAPAN|nr:Actin-related protein 2/3 complex subunit 2A [Capsicum annuum]